MTEPLIGITKIKTENDMIDLQTEKLTIRQKTLKKLNQTQAEYTKKHEPFCFRCAKIDIEDQQQRDWNRKGRLTGADRIENVPVELNLEQYSEPKRFKLLAEKTIIQ